MNAVPLSTYAIRAVKPQHMPACQIFECVYGRTACSCNRQPRKGAPIPKGLLLIYQIPVKTLCTDHAAKTSRNGQPAIISLDHLCTALYACGVQPLKISWLGKTGFDTRYGELHVPVSRTMHCCCCCHHVRASCVADQLLCCPQQVAPACPHRGHGHSQQSDRRRALADPADTAQAPSLQGQLTTSSPTACQQCMS